MIKRFANLRVLVVDDMSAMRAAIKVQLSEMEIVNVDQAGNADDAIRMLETRGEYDAIFCDYNLNKATSGQQFLEFIKSQELLPPSTIFIMVTAEAEYGSVVSAAEFQPDDYLLKPFTASKIKSRLERLIDRRDALQMLTQRLAKKDFAGAVAESDKLIKANSKWIMEALRRKGEALLQTGRHEEAITAYQAALAMRSDLGWAQLGLARGHFAAGGLDQARAIANDILERNGAYVLVYDLLAEIAEEQGDFETALDFLRQSLVVVPSARRNRIVAEAAYRMDNLEVARTSFEQAIRKTKGSITAQATDCLFLAQTLVDSGEPKQAFLVLEAGTGEFGDKGVFAQVQAAIKAQAYLRQNDPAGARKMLARAGNLIPEPGGNLATVFMARALLAAGEEQEGMRLLDVAARGASGSRAIQGLAKKMRRDAANLPRNAELSGAS